MTNLINNIEDLRQKLCNIIANKDLTDAEVVLCSEELDKLLLECERNNNLRWASKASQVLLLTKYIIDKSKKELRVTYF